MIIFTPFAEPLSTVFTFKSSPISTPSLSFRKSSHPRAPKRSRPTSDVDELITTSKKKRRLRLLLITSRLSRPFSTPATHIVDRGMSKIAVWAKQQHLAPQALRKAAIMNRVRRKTLERKDSGISIGEDARREVREEKKLREELNIEEPAVFGLGPNAVRYADDAKSSVPPSPLGLSNYDALDEEDDWYENCDDVGDAETGGLGLQMPANQEIRTHQEDKYYSDFNFFDFQASRMGSSDHEDDDNDPFGLSLLTSEIDKERRPPSPPEDKLIELMKEQCRQREITSSFLHFSL